MAELHHVERVNCSFDSALLAEIDRTAKVTGRTRSGFLGYAARRLIDVGEPPTIDHLLALFGALYQTVSAVVHQNAVTGWR